MLSLLPLLLLRSLEVSSTLIPCIECSVRVSTVGGDSAVEGLAGAGAAVPAADLRDVDAAVCFLDFFLPILLVVPAEFPAWPPVR